MATLTVIAFDPGGTTGWSMFRAQLIEIDGEQAEMYDPKWTQGQIGPEEHHDALWTFMELMHTDYTILVCESFEFRNKARAGLVLVSREYIGIIKLFKAQRKVILSMQTAAQGKGFVKDANIKKLGLWSPGFKHANDATRHLLWYLINAAPASIKDTIRPQLLETGWK